MLLTPDNKEVILYDPYVKEVNHRSLGLDIAEGADLTATINMVCITGVKTGEEEEPFAAGLSKEGVIALPPPEFKHQYHTSIVFNN
jgi:hypothetical protein